MFGGLVIKIYIHRNSRQYGPYSDESIREYLRSGKVSGNDLAWIKGENAWVSLSDLVDVGEEQEQVAIESDELTEQQVLEYTEKIKVLVSSDQEELAVELLRSLDSPRLYEELLKECSIDEDGKPQLPDWSKDDEGNELVSFFLELIAHCPTEAQINPSLRKESITHLHLVSCYSLTNVDGLSNLTNLTKLDLSYCYSLTRDKIEKLKEALSETDISF